MSAPVDSYVLIKVLSIDHTFFIFSLFFLLFAIICPKINRNVVKTTLTQIENAGFPWQKPLAIVDCQDEF